MMNDTGLDDECTEKPIDIQLLWKIVLITLYSFVGVASLIGNLIVILIVVLRKEMQTVTNIFISSVSAASLVITGVSLWASPLSYYRQTWFLGEYMCYIVNMVQGASLIWVPFTLTAIAIDRYLLVASPFRSQMSIKTCLFIIMGIYLSAFAVLTPMLANLYFYDLPCIKFCAENWRPNNEYRLMYGISVLVIRSGVPLIVIAWCHWQIATILNKQANKFKKSSMGSSEVGRKQRLQTLLKAMVIIFAVSSFPLDLFNVLQDLEMVLKMRFGPEYLYRFIFFSSHWIAMSGTLLNPLVYAWCNENFRRQIQDCVSELRGDTSVKRGLYAVVISGGRRGDEPRSIISDSFRKGSPEELMSGCKVAEEEGDVQV